MRRLFLLILLFPQMMLFAQTETLEPEIPTKLPSSLDWNADDSKIAIGYHDGTIDIINVNTLAVEHSRQLGLSIHEVEWSPTDPNILAIAIDGNYEEPGEIFIIDISTASFEIIDIYSASVQINAIAWKPDGLEIAGLFTERDPMAIPNRPYGSIIIWEITSADIIFETVIPSAIEFYWANSAYNFLFFSDIAGIFRFDLIEDTETTLYKIGRFEFLSSVALSSDASELAIARSGNKKNLILLDVDNGRIRNLISTDFVTNIQWSNSGLIAYARPISSAISVYDPVSQTEIATTSVDFNMAYGWNTVGDTIAYINAGEDLEFSQLSTP